MPDFEENKPLLDSKLVKILDVFIKNKTKLFHLQKLSQESKVPIATTFRVISKLVSLGFVDVIVVGKLKLYRIKEKIPSTKILIYSNITQILNVFIKNPTQLYHLKKLSQESKVPLATVFRLVSNLSKSGYIEIVLVGKMKLYKASERTKAR